MKKVYGIRKTLETDEQLEFLSFKAVVQNSRLRQVRSACCRFLPSLPPCLPAEKSSIISTHMNNRMT